MHLYVDYVLWIHVFYLTLIMVTTRAGHAKKKSGAELDDDDDDNHGMYL